MYETLLMKHFHQINIYLSATVFTCIFVNHRVVLELEQVSVKWNSVGQQTWRHRWPPFLQSKTGKIVRGERTRPRAHQYVFVSDRPPLYKSYDSIWHPEYNVVQFFITCNVLCSKLTCKRISSTPNCLPRPAVFFWPLLAHLFDPENFGFWSKTTCVDLAFYRNTWRLCRISAPWPRTLSIYLHREIWMVVNQG